jgi:hypothetical protein
MPGQTDKDSDGDTFYDGTCPGGNDCDDSNSTIHPNAAENCADGVDNDCDGLTDAADPGCAPCVVDDDCDDSTVCNGIEPCLGGFCQPGTPPVCDDDNVCTDDSCDNASGCLNINNTDPCDDGLYCSENDVCATGTCGGTARDCSSADDQCNQGVCDDNIDACLADPAPKQGQACDDTYARTITDTCDNGSCVGVLLDADSDGYVSDGCGGTDCDDSDSAVNTGVSEICDDTVDNDCNGDVDLDDETCKRPAAGCDCSTQGSATPALLLGLLILRRRK